jgi:hypothetical protein
MIHAKGTGFIREYTSNARLDPPTSLTIAQKQTGNSKERSYKMESLENKMQCA